MEININFSLPSHATMEDVATVLAKIQVNMVSEYIDGYFGPGDFEVYSDGDCIATYKVLAEPDGDSENFYPFNCLDYSDDADALASAGMATDEDYGYYGGNEDF